MRTSETQVAGTTRYLLDGLSVIAQYDTGGTRQAWYTQSLARIDEVLNVVNEGGKQWYQADALGSIYGLTSASGALLATTNYDVFGALNPQPTGPAGQPFGFTGREHELDSGLVYARARYLNPGTGRWDRADPLGLIPSPNVYTYLDSSPLTGTDPHGLYPFYVHDYIIDAALPGVPSDVRQILQAAQWDADFGNGAQGAQSAYRHAMRCSTQLQEEALNLWWGFVIGQLVNAAAEFRNVMGGPGPITPATATKALSELGLGMHAVQDLSAPGHTGFQVWNSVSTGVVHIGAEVLLSPLRTPDVVDAIENTRRYYKAFQKLIWFPAITKGTAIDALGGTELYDQAFWTIIKPD